jgi:hypothetical protein
LETSLVIAVGTLGTPVKVGEARGAYDVVTKAVVAILVLLSPEDGVVEVGVPVKAGLANGGCHEPSPVSGL